MEFRILGPLEVLEGELPVPLPGPRQRSLLALLLLHANEVVSSDRLVDELWSHEDPDSGSAALQASVSRLRKALGGGSELLATVPPGYVVRVGPDQLDLHRFEALVAGAADADPAAAADALRDALALWRGPPLAEFAYERFAETAIGRLDELRLLALEKRIDADLALGRHRDLVPELETLVSQHPLREGLRVQLMLALYRGGRQADALEAFQAARRTLVEQLGIEPASALTELEKAILRHDPALELEFAEQPRRSILVAGVDAPALDPLLAVAEPLAQRPAREVIVLRLLASRDDLAAATREVTTQCERLAEDGVTARSALFTSTTPGADVARLATEQDVDLIIVAASSELLDDPDLAELLRVAPCDVAVSVGKSPVPGPVLVPFAGAEHDWSAIELGAWLAGSWSQPLRLAGPAVEGGRDASRLLASASLAVQRALGVPAEPLLVEPGPEAFATAARDVAVTVMGLSDRWREEGLGPARSRLVASGQPTLLVRKGLRPGGLAPPENLTRFTWSLKAG